MGEQNMYGETSADARENDEYGSLRKRMRSFMKRKQKGGNERRDRKRKRQDKKILRKIESAGNDVKRNKSRTLIYT